jgi:hypothetical protein
MKTHGRTSVHEFLGDFLVYRNLVPLDRRLPGLDSVCSKVGLPSGVTPRKSEAAYAQVIAVLLRQARTLDQPGVAIERLVYVGDTRLNDGTAFANVCRAGSWPGVAFIASENSAPAEVEVIEHEGQTLYLSNRWAALADFDRFCREQGGALDERTAVIVDLDKTALGARGRNDRVIDRARVEAVRRTVGDFLGDSFDPVAFEEAYNLLNGQEFHPFTTDNQDYLAYICLILGSGLLSLAPLVEQVRTGELGSFRQFITDVNQRADELPRNLAEIHDTVYACVQQGDPTPFKAFRYNEYQTTIGRMGQLDDGLPIGDLLAEEIVITQEVRQVALAWRQQGALLFGLSDKPDEASIPTPELAAEGFQPIHQVETHALGE